MINPRMRGTYLSTFTGFLSGNQNDAYWHSRNDTHFEFTIVATDNIVNLYVFPEIT
jgi:hypothetical protein